MNALLLLAVLAANPTPCAAKEAAVRSMHVYLAAAKLKAEAAADGTTEERYAAHMEVQVALSRHADAVSALEKCRAYEAAK